MAVIVPAFVVEVTGLLAVSEVAVVGYRFRRKIPFDAGSAFRRAVAIATMGY